MQKKYNFTEVIDRQEIDNAPALLVRLEIHANASDRVYTRTIDGREYLFVNDVQIAVIVEDYRGTK